VLATRDSAARPGQAASGNDIALAGPGPALAAAAPPSRAHPRPSRPWPAPPARRGSDAPATDRTGGTDVAMATPPHHAEPAAPPPPPWPTPWCSARVKAWPCPTA
jgi:hypothetical protein